MNPATEFRIRRATAADATALAAVGRDTFVETFGHLYRPADLQAFLTSSHTPAGWAELLADRRAGVWLAPAENGPEVAGFGVFGPCKLPVLNLEPRAGEVRQLYLRSAAQGAGLGTRLLKTGLDWLATEGYAPLYVGVWSENYGAQRLYGRYGFVKVGEYDFPVGEHLDREFILRQPTPPTTRLPTGS